MSVVVMVLIGAVAALVRGEVTARLGRRRGTAAVNYVGAFIAGLVVGVVGGPGVDHEALLLLSGGAGALTTYSTWMLDTLERPPADRVPALVVSLLAGMVLVGAGWALGSLVG